MEIAKFFEPFYTIVQSHVESDQSYEITNKKSTIIRMIQKPRPSTTKHEIEEVFKKKN